jgi:hypothetical protein
VPNKAIISSRSLNVESIEGTLWKCSQQHFSDQFSHCAKRKAISHDGFFI